MTHERDLWGDARLKQIGSALQTAGFWHRHENIVGE